MNKAIFTAALILAATMASACPNFSGKFQCTDQGEKWIMEIEQTEKEIIATMNGTDTAVFPIEGEEVDEDGIFESRQCSGDTLVVTQKADNLSAKYVVSLRGDRLSYRGKTIAAVYDEETDSMDGYIKEPMNFSCKRIN